MEPQSQFIFSRKTSSFFSLLIIFLFAFIMGAIILRKSSQLAELQKPMPLYISSEYKGLSK